MDAGPGLNFFSIHQERLLIRTVGALSIPETVRDEIVRKSRIDSRFEAAEGVLKKLPEHLLAVLSDAPTDDLNAVVSRIAGIPMEERRLTGKDLGELMVIAHAVVAAEAGHEVTVLIDDGAGREFAVLEINRIRRLKMRGTPGIGGIALLSTPTVLRRAAGLGHIADRAQMRELYERLRTLDDGLVPLEGTDLMRLECWR